ncbi:unnamed protein product, partial [Tilletia controversa]
MLAELYETRYLEDRLPVPKARAWVDMVLPELDDSRFRTWVRMDRATFGLVHDLIASNPIFGTSATARSPQSSVAEQLAIALHKFGMSGSGSGIRIEAGHWATSEGHIVKCMKRVTRALSD